MSVCVYPRPSRSMGSPRRHGSPGIDLLSSFSAGSKKILRAFHGGRYTGAQIAWRWSWAESTGKCRVSEITVVGNEVWVATAPLDNFNPSDIWRFDLDGTQLGLVSGKGSVSAMTVVIPEPTTPAFLIVGMAMALCRRSG